MSTNGRTEQDIHQTLSRALDADEGGRTSEAIDLYASAVEGILRLVAGADSATRTRLNPFATRALDRAEQLKAVHKAVTSKTATNPTPPVTARGPTNPAAGPSSSVATRRSVSSTATNKSASGTYTDAEKKVLQHTSHINSNTFLPFMQADLGERFYFPIPFTDRDGLLSLAAKQRAELGGWRRISELHPDPQLIVGEQISFLSIKQTVVSDCSLIASLAVAAKHERRHSQPLIRSIIWPRNRNDQPIYNESGKYSVRLHINGIQRKVIIDDQLPVNRSGQLLCSYSSNRNEFWVSLLEKAYMKVMGGYDFPGSNSSIDLHALTGWIPERIAINAADPHFDADALYTRLHDSLAQGRCLITCATGVMGDEQTERTGLVGGHAYAVLDLRHTPDGVRLVQMKNPWSHLRWRGNYSELDAVHWTDELRTALGYDPALAAQVDNGVFWIDYASVLKFFDVFYLNWDPALFGHTYCLHRMWSAGVGPMRDAYTIGDNQQYRLSVGAGRGSVWVLLSRHITNIDDFRENREYLAVLVYQNRGRRVYYPNDPAPFIDGVRINSPHYLCKIRLDPQQAKDYTLVVSQYEKTATIYYTLRAYCRDPFELRPLDDEYATQRQLTGEWTAETAGGCANHPQTYGRNPRFALQLPRDARSVIVELRAPKVYQVGLEVRVDRLENSDTVTAPFVSRTSREYRPGFIVLALDDLPAGRYVLIPSTFLPDLLGPFLLNVKTTSAGATVQAC